MIIRKPSRIELKRENDLDDYNLYKKKLDHNRMNQRKNLLMMDENGQMSFLTPNPIRNRDKIGCESAQFSGSCNDGFGLLIDWTGFLKFADFSFL